MRILFNLTIMLTFMFVVNGASATIINFQAMADGTVGESAWTTLSLTGDGFTMDITGSDSSDNDPVQYAYLDRNTAGLGVCSDLLSGATADVATGSGTNLCAPGSDDNVTTNESLHFVFSSDVVIETIWFNNNHDIDQSLFGDSIDIGGSTFIFETDLGGPADYPTTSPYFVYANTSFDIVFNNEQFYVSKIDVRAVPEPASLALMSLGLLGLGFSRRKRLQ